MSAASPAAPSPASVGPASLTTALASAKVKGRMSTPRQLFLLQVAILALAGLLLLVGEVTLNRTRAAMNTIARDSAPSIVAAQDIRFALADLDANAANYLIGTAFHRALAADAIEQRRIHVTAALVKAAENITYGDDERGPIKAMFLSFGIYLERLAEARMLHDHADDGHARDAYLTATGLMHGELFKQADALDAVNKKHLDAAYDEQAQSNEGMEALAAVVGIALGAALLWTQVYLFRKMRRIFNLPLLAATVLTIVFTGYLIERFNDAREDLRSATKDAFDSIYALSHARAVAYDANGDESRFLLDPSPGRGFESDFLKNIALLTSKPQLASGPLGAEALRLINHGRRNPDFKGYFWDELANVTFDGEGDAATGMVKAFSLYYAIDDRMRALERAGKHDDAVELCIGSRPDESNAAFDRFDQGLLATLAINRQAFDATVEKGDLGLKKASWMDPGFAVVIAVLGWLGLRSRRREYTA